MGNKIRAGILILCGIGFAVCIGYFLKFMYAFGAFDKDYSVSELKENFAENETEILALKKYFNEIVPDDRFVSIEFDDDSTLGRLDITAVDLTDGSSGPLFMDWNLKIHTAQMDSIIQPLGWTRETLKALKQKLDEADCILIESGEPAKIGFKRSGLGMYSFNVFDEPVPDSLKDHYNDSCMYILAGDKLVLEYGGGAVGGQCFYNLR